MGNENAAQIVKEIATIEALRPAQTQLLFRLFLIFI
jgi:hypothetical protein